MLRKRLKRLNRLRSSRLNRGKITVQIDMDHMGSKEVIRRMKMNY